MRHPRLLTPRWPQAPLCGFATLVSRAGD